MDRIHTELRQVTILKVCIFASPFSIVNASYASFIPERLRLSSDEHVCSCWISVIFRQFEMFNVLSSLILPTHLSVSNCKHTLYSKLTNVYICTYNTKSKNSSLESNTHVIQQVIFNSKALKLSKISKVKILRFSDVMLKVLKAEGELAAKTCYTCSIPHSSICFDLLIVSRVILGCHFVLL